jgi:hypothetical protein
LGAFSAADAEDAACFSIDGKTEVHFTTLCRIRLPAEPEDGIDDQLDPRAGGDPTGIGEFAGAPRGAGDFTFTGPASLTGGARRGGALAGAFEGTFLRAAGAAGLPEMDANLGRPFTFARAALAAGRFFAGIEFT